ncbi:MAG: dethiobiotin synthase [Gammaproteobacteria bacterium]
MSRGLFITGTDIGVGKTLITSGLLQALGAEGHTTLAMKPVATGCWQTADGLRSEDAEDLIAAMNQDASYREVNPVALETTAEPIVSAMQNRFDFTTDELAAQAVSLARRADWLLIEGPGGVQTPITGKDTTADLALAIGFPVVLIVGLRVGCLNHATLSVELLQQKGLRIAGWIGNEHDGAMAELEPTVHTLEKQIPADCLAIIRWQPRLDRQQLARQLHPAARKISR